MLKPRCLPNAETIEWGDRGPYEKSAAETTLKSVLGCERLKKMAAPFCSGGTAARPL